jgi:hypothetical protein
MSVFISMRDGRETCQLGLNQRTETNSKKYWMNVTNDWSVNHAGMAAIKLASRALSICTFTGSAEIHPLHEGSFHL